MWLAHGWRLIVAALLGAAVAGSLSITGYLVRLQTGVEQNVAAGRALVETQKAVRDKNTLLSDMVTVTNRIAVALDGLLARSEAIGAQVRAVREANQATAALNGEIESNNQGAARELARVAASLRRMNTSAATIREHIGALRETVSADVDALKAIGANTARMNARTPGW